MTNNTTIDFYDDDDHTNRITDSDWEIIESKFEDDGRYDPSEGNRFKFNEGMQSWEEIELDCEPPCHFDEGKGEWIEEAS